MPAELIQWIAPAVIVGVMLYLHRLTRQDIKGLRGEITDLRNHVDSSLTNLRSVDTGNGNLRGHVDSNLTNLRGHVDSNLADLRSSSLADLRNHVDSSLADLRSHVDSNLKDLRNRMGRLEERMARLEGTLDVLRQFLVRNGRGTAA